MLDKLSTELLFRIVLECSGREVGRMALANRRLAAVVAAIKSARLRKTVFDKITITSLPAGGLMIYREREEVSGGYQALWADEVSLPQFPDLYKLFRLVTCRKLCLKNVSGRRLTFLMKLLTRRCLETRILKFKKCNFSHFALQDDEAEKILKQTFRFRKWLNELILYENRRLSRLASPIALWKLFSERAPRLNVLRCAVPWKGNHPTSLFEEKFLASAVSDPNSPLAIADLSRTCVDRAGVLKAKFKCWLAGEPALAAILEMDRARGKGQSGSSCLKFDNILYPSLLPDFDATFVENILLDCRSSWGLTESHVKFHRSWVLAEAEPAYSEEVARVVAVRCDGFRLNIYCKF